MNEDTVGREPVQIVELLQPFCTNSFGIAPCAATGTDDEKCYNTRASCLDPENFALGTLSLFFSHGGLVGPTVPEAIHLMPALIEVSTAPSRVNIAGADPDAQGIGQRAVCTIRLSDFDHNDRRVDPYAADRSWTTVGGGRGTFWSRWLARNRYRANLEVRVYDGYAGQALSSMVRRTYFLEHAVLSRGVLTITCKDILARLEERRAQAPLASPGVLAGELSDAATGFEITGAGVDDYPAPGTLRIGSEVMTFTARSATSEGVAITGVLRGTDNTEAASHQAGDSVQLCLRFSEAPVADALEDLLTTYGAIPSSWIDAAGWEAEATDYLVFMRLTGLVTEPTPVTDLVSEIQVQTMCFLWWDERAALIGLRAVRGIETEPPLITDSAHIVADSFEITEEPDRRVSRAWVFFGQIDPTKSVDDEANYRSIAVFGDPDSEGEARYGQPAVRKVFARFLRSNAQADVVAAKLLTRYVEVPARARFRLDAKDRAVWLGDLVKISHPRDRDVHGVRQVRYWSIVSAEEVIPGETVEYEAIDATLHGLIYRIQPNDAVDYPGAGLAALGAAYIGDSDGLLSDGSPCARIN